MPTTFEENTGAAKGHLEKLIRRDFPELTEAKVTVTLMFAANADGAAIKHHGVPELAKIKVNSLSDRAEGKADATLTVDQDKWDERTDRQHEAILAHELTHLVVKRDKDGVVKVDDCGRPKLGTIPDDWTINGFYSNVQRYGADAPERETLEAVCREWKQRKLWDFADLDPVPGEPILDTILNGQHPFDRAGEQLRGATA